jgi:formylglycine-generating enzyme required for sulfatase activity
MQNNGVSARRRQRAGHILGNIGWIPEDLDEFVEVPAGEFTYGDKREKHTIPYRYWIGKYPVTNFQYARFIENRGYKQQEFWSKEGWEWLMSKKRTQPAYWLDREQNITIFPVNGVSWYEAEAYCNWLNTQSHVTGMQFMPDGYIMRLPIEGEWERAARGVDGREYPWGDKFGIEFANTTESNLEGRFRIGTTAVCTYPAGASPVGAWDMSGNIWEWTNSWFSAEQETRVVRGGSWLLIQGVARCATRLGRLPVTFVNYLGFRVVVSLADS